MDNASKEMKEQASKECRQGASPESFEIDTRSGYPCLYCMKCMAVVGSVGSPCSALRAVGVETGDSK